MLVQVVYWLLILIFFTWHHEEGEEGKCGGWNTADAYSVPDQLLACYISRRKLIQI